MAPPLLDERVRRLIDAPATQRRLPLAFAAAMLALVTVTSARWAFAFSLATLPSAPVSTSTPVDWFMEGIAACDSGDTAGADEAYDHLIELDRAALAARCSADGLGHCTAGFARHDP